MKLRLNNGYSLVELIVVLIIIGVMTTVAMRSMRATVVTGKVEDTKAELDHLAWAIAGNPELQSGGKRTDYGYIGDVGAMPPNLDALITNPGAYSTWQGPYIFDQLSVSGTTTGHTTDAWGNSYTLNATTIVSSGGGSSISRVLANNSGELLRNQVRVTVTDLSNTPPGNVYDDSVKLLLTIPNGSGGTTTKQKFPASDGLVTFDSIPIGAHLLRAIYLPDNDTMRRIVNVDPGQVVLSTIQFRQNDWGGAGSTYIADTIRPDGVGATTQLSNQGDPINWKCVDEFTSDGNTTRVVGTNNQTKEDTYTLASATYTSGTIDSVVVVMLVDKNGNNQTAKTAIRTSGTTYYGSAISLNSMETYLPFSTAYTTNPGTSSAWTWPQIASLEAGVQIYDNGKCTQVFVVVYSTP